jgi:hypothetical protein
VTEPEKQKTKKERIAALESYRSIDVREEGHRTRTVTVGVSCYTPERPTFKVEARDYASGFSCSIDDLDAKALRDLIAGANLCLAFAEQRLVAERLIRLDPEIPDDKEKPRTDGKVSPAASIDDSLPF